MPNYRKTMDYFTISSAADAADFGDAVQYGTSPAGCSSLTKAFFSGAFASWASPKYSNVTSEFTFASTGDASDVGDVTQGFSNAAESSGSTEARVITKFGGRDRLSGTARFMDEIHYMNPASAGNSTDFGDLSIATMAGGSGNGVRMVSGGGTDEGGAADTDYDSDIHYITIASTGNATESSGTLPFQKKHSVGWTA